MLFCYKDYFFHDKHTIKYEFKYDKFEINQKYAF